jgi:hypothetical protein
MASAIHFVRHLRFPLQRQQLAPLDPKREAVRVELPLSETAVQGLARFLRDYPSACLFLDQWPDQRGKTDLGFLRHLPWLRRLKVNVYWLTSLSGLEAVPLLEELCLSQTASSRLSLAPLAACRRLKSLWIDGLNKDIDALCELRKLEELRLTRVGLPDLSLLRSHPALLALELIYGNTTDLAALPSIPRLRELALRHVTGLKDLAPLGKCRALQLLWLQTLPKVRSLPSLGTLKKLRSVVLENCKNLKDLRPIAAAPALEDLCIQNMPHLTVKHFQPFVGHEALRGLTAGLGVQRNNAAVQELLGIHKQARHRTKFSFRK